ncbi:MAG TPA: hypothetical protein VFW47_04295 [Phenylobacterium sp.]|nr:hypothetical protein [Phenylobacterium sp.]
MGVRAIAISVLLSGALAASAASAGEACGAPVPAVGTEVHGPVLNVLDGRRLCVALGVTPDQWLEVELPDQGLIRAAAHPDANPRGTLMAATFARNLTCRVIEDAGDHAIAACSLDGRPVGRLAERRRTIETGRDWR